MIAFQVSLIFEPVKEIYTENMSDLYLMKNVTILRKVLVTMKTFVPLFFNQFEPEQKTMLGNTSHEKETKHFCFRCQFVTY